MSVQDEQVRSYEEWTEGIAAEIRKGPVWRFYGYRKALFLYDLEWADCTHWQKNRRGRAIVDQIMRSAGSISAKSPGSTVNGEWQIANEELRTVNWWSYSSFIIEEVTLGL